MHGKIPIKQEPIRILRFSSKTTLPYKTFNNYHRSLFLHRFCDKSSKKVLRNIPLELKNPRVLTFYVAILVSNSMKFLIHRTRSKHLLLKLNTFIILNMITKLSVLKFISKVSSIYCSWFESLLRELSLRSRDANRFAPCG